MIITSELVLSNLKLKTPVNIMLYSVLVDRITCNWSSVLMDLEYIFNPKESFGTR